MKSVVRFVFYVFLVFLVFASLIETMKEEPPVLPECTDEFIVINDENDRMHQRNWNMMYHSNSFCTSYESSEALSLSTGEKRNEIEAYRTAYEDVWGEIYRQLVNESRLSIDFLADSLIQIANHEKLSNLELAELVVTFVQDIPYSYVRSRPCSESNNHGKPCIGNITYGLLSPYEFLHSLYGDCDTRAVLIYTLLDTLGFDPMIVVSREYAHAMLALNISASGDHLKYRGKNYYFWETTGVGWPIGMLPPNSNNVKYWKIALVH